jgi:hypothetical protein
MRRIVAFGLVGVVLGSATGCGGPDALMREALVNLNAYADAIERKEPPDRQLASLDRFRATEEKLDKLPAGQGASRRGAQEPGARRRHGPAQPARSLSQMTAEFPRR